MDAGGCLGRQRTRPPLTGFPFRLRKSLATDVRHQSLRWLARHGGAAIDAANLRGHPRVSSGCLASDRLRDGEECFSSWIRAGPRRGDREAGRCFAKSFRKGCDLRLPRITPGGCVHAWVDGGGPRLPEESQGAGPGPLRRERGFHCSLWAACFGVGRRSSRPVRDAPRGKLLGAAVMEALPYFSPKSSATRRRSWTQPVERLGPLTPASKFASASAMSSSAFDRLDLTPA